MAQVLPNIHQAPPAASAATPAAAPKTLEDRVTAIEKKLDDAGILREPAQAAALPGSAPAGQ